MEIKLKWFEVNSAVDLNLLPFMEKTATIIVNYANLVSPLEIHRNTSVCVCVFMCPVCFSEHHRTRLVCENERLRLMCKNETVLAIYSASFGHLLHGSPYCPQEPGSHVDMGLKQNIYCHI